MKMLLVHVSGLHLGYVGCYGNDWVDTPTLDRLASEGAVFDHHYADCPGQWDTAWTGKYRYGWLTRKPLSAAPGLTGLLAANGIPVIRITAAQMSAAGHINPASYHDEIRQSLLSAVEGVSGSANWLISLELPSLVPPWLVGEDFLAHYFLPDTETMATEEGLGKQEEAENEADAEEMNEIESEVQEIVSAEVEWPNDEYDLTSDTELPFDDSLPDSYEDEESGEEVLLMPLLDPPVGLIDVNDDTLAQRLQLSYAAAVSQADTYLHTALEQLRASGVLEETLLIVTADHGLPLGEHGLVGDARPWLHEELVHLPLLICLPGAVEAGRRVGALTQPVDLFPTILEAFGIGAPANHGHSLFPLLHGKSAGHRDYVCAGVRIDDVAEWALRTREWALLLPEDSAAPRKPQLYAKPEDRWEVNDLRQHNLDLAENLEETLRKWVKAVEPEGPLQPPPLSGSS